MDTVEKYKQQLLEQSQRLWDSAPITDATANAYLATPRHRFVQRYREWGIKEWQEVSEKNLQEHLATLYANKTLILFGEDDENIPSTISQPGFVLRMLDMLQLKPGQSVFELGAGSGWNAALMGRLVGPEGHVSSLEIIPEVAQKASEIIATLEIRNVNIIAADGGEGYAPSGPYDRAVFTAGTYDLPHHFYDQMKENGLILVVIKSGGGGDNLFLLRKTGDHFESLESTPCGFVPLRGKYEIGNLEPITVEELPDWANLQRNEISRTSFWWGGNWKNDFMWQTLGIRSFLGITEPSFRAFKMEKVNGKSHEKQYFGLWEQEHSSLVLAKDDNLISYGNTNTKDRLLQKVRQWVDLGMPSATSFRLRVYPVNVSLTAEYNEWIVKRRESQFLWSLEV